MAFLDGMDEISARGRFSRLEVSLVTYVRISSSGNGMYEHSESNNTLMASFGSDIPDPTALIFSDKLFIVPSRHISSPHNHVKTTINQKQAQVPEASTFN